MNTPETLRDATTLARAHPLTLFGLDALVVAAARLRPKSLALCDRGDDAESPVVFEELDRLIAAFCGRLRELDFAPGARALLCCAPRAESVVAFAALLVGGVEPVLAPLNLDAATYAAAAQATGAEALFSPTAFDGLDFESLVLETAAKAPALRLIGALSGPAIDGAADFSRAALRRDAAATSLATEPRPRVGFLSRRGALDFVSHSALLAAALEFIRLTRRGGNAPVLCLVSPASFGAFVAGPLAALLAGAPLYFAAPFFARRFLSLLDAIAPARLVAPTSTYADFSLSGALCDGSLVSCAFVSRAGAPRLAAPPAGACPIVEIVGETMRIVPSAAPGAASLVA